jgi:TolB protein
MKSKSFFEKRIVIFVLITIFIFSILSIGWIALGLIKKNPTPTIPSFTGTVVTHESLDQIASIQITPANTPTLTEIPKNANPTVSPSIDVSHTNALILSMREKGYYHLFFYQPVGQSFIQLTKGSWDDVSPAIDPEGTKIVYCSNRNGFWDLYLLDLESGETYQLTVSKDFEGSPAWSPDGVWIVFEQYLNDNLQLFILEVNNLSNPAKQLTFPGPVSLHPTWSPRGREIAFTQIQNGQSLIWEAKLINIPDRFSQVSNSSSINQANAAWSPSGQYLAWSGMTEGNRFIFVKDMDHPNLSIRTIGNGSFPVWDNNDKIIYTIAESPNQTDLVGYNIENGTLAFPMIHLPTAVRGFTQIQNIGQTWLNSYLRSSEVSFPQYSETDQSTTFTTSGMPNVVDLEGINAPQASLLPSVKESFFLLKSDLSSKIGWDFLKTLDNAFIPLTVPPDPGDANTWLYTGKAIAVNSKALSAGWLAIAREDFAGQIYWRVYVKCYSQDGSLGSPIPQLVWDISSRSSGSKQAYQEGGQYILPPSGYWIDFTEIARNHRWERLPSLANWRSYYPAIRYNQFFIPGGIDILSSLGQLYPPEALMTFTPFPTSAQIPSGTSIVNP